jgi:hypothetical protein
VKYPSLWLTGPEVNLASKTAWLPRTASLSTPTQASHQIPQALACAALWLTLCAGVDDVLAILLALTARPEELEVAMISVTYGNVSLQRSAPPCVSW